MFNPFDFAEHPGRAYLIATLLPLVPVVLLLIAATARNMARSRSHTDSFASRIYWLLGGDRPLKTGGYLSLVFLLASFGLSVWGLLNFFEESHTLHDQPKELSKRWAERGDWLRVGSAKGDRPAAALQTGYRIDQLTALMFTMVTGIGSLIFLFSLGYMNEETEEIVDDHKAHTTRRGRFGRFYLYLSLFAFSMLNLLIADNLFQVFVGWELVGVCSFFLIGFYYERKSASTAANNAFLVNRIGDAGLLIGIAIAFATFGTLNFQDLAELIDGRQPSEMSHGLWILMGLGLFVGCVGKSAQVPLQTWLPDAMEGPTPVSALIHAATMVAAGVYLVGRCYPLFAPEVFLTIAYCGLITLILSASVALVMTDIKRVLAFSTCSQLGFMMLALGVGAWTAGLLHLLTHAFFKALLFLGAGSVIRGCHHEQDLRQMGGLRRKMPITAYAMLVGVLAISGIPFFSGWYSKDQILSSALGYSVAHNRHALLFFGPLIAAGMTAFYMFRLWFLAFTGPPRNAEVYRHARESPFTMVLPLIALALCSLGIAWGWPPWDAEASFLGHMLHEGEPLAARTFAHARESAEDHHLAAGGLALLAAVIGAAYSWSLYGRRAPTTAQLTEPTGVLAKRWYFDDVYDFVFLRGSLRLAALAANADRSGPEQPRRYTLDGAMSGFAALAVFGGRQLRKIQTGSVRQYVLALVLTLIGLLGMLSAFAR